MHAVVTAQAVKHGDRIRSPNDTFRPPAIGTRDPVPASAEDPLLRPVLARSLVGTEFTESDGLVPPAGPTCCARRAA